MIVLFGMEKWFSSISLYDVNIYVTSSKHVPKFNFLKTL